MLRPGHRLGPYEIVTSLGSGGMGEVYRARDTRLNRDVAVKVLPSAFSTDPDRLSRFEQEARATSALNHPNILSVFDVGRAEISPYVVTELLEGETLAALINGTALPVRKAIDYATQIARGLAAAHGRGIVHRDLKPDNMFVTSDGRIKILDFGLAKQIDAPSVPSSVTAVPTAVPNTLPGVVLGTVGYMSPEQVRGHSTDPRSDIFAFGAILYEMLSGHRAFRGESAIETMSAILREEPQELSATSRTLPPGLDRIVHHCLEKSPDQRFQSASDIAFALEALSGSSESAAALAAAAEPSAPPRLRTVLAWKVCAATAAVVAMISAPIAIIHWREAPPALRPVRFSIDLPDNISFSTTAVPNLSVSPDGRYLAFVASSVGVNRLWLRRLDEGEARPLPGTEGAATPFWSPDSRSIAFVATTKLKKIDIGGGAPQTIGELPPLFQAGDGAWGPANVILIGSASRASAGGVLLRIPAGGGEFVPATSRDSTGASHALPVFLPDGRHFLFSKQGVDAASSGLFHGVLDSQETRRISADFGKVQFANGFVLFPRDGSLIARPFDPARAEFTGEAVSIADGVLMNQNSRNAAYAASDSVLLFYTGRGQTTELTWFTRGGQPIGTVGTPGTHATMAIATDMSRVVYGRQDTQTFSQSLWITELMRTVTTRLTFGTSRDSDGVWSPDLTHIAYSSVRSGIKSLYEIPSAGGAERELMKGEQGPLSSDAWSPDGRYLLYHIDGSQEIRALTMRGDEKPFLVVRTTSGRADERVFSSDGKWLSYGSEESGRWDVYVMPFPPTGARWQVSTNGGGQARWRADGRELFYLAPDGTMMAVDLKAGAATVELGTPHALFRTNVQPAFNIDQYGVSADGQRFLIMSPVRDTKATPMTLVLDWQALIKGKS